tara:strand:+ start:6150 stop:6782 length:633 start_codon:yes stop_codon:yes gene_type:complete
MKRNPIVSTLDLKMRSLYAITPDAMPTDILLSKTKILLECGVKIFQLRDKLLKKNEVKERAYLMNDLIHAFGAKLLINDYVDIAIDVDADGVHLGQEDMTCSEARSILGEEKIIGISCNNRLELALNAEKNRASYVGLGSIFLSLTKVSNQTCSIKQLNLISNKLKIPSVAVGGINENNLKHLKKTKASYLALSAGLYTDESCKIFKEFS